MGITDIKQRLHDIPGIESLTMTMIAGRQQYNIGGKVIAVDGGASDLVAQEAIRAAFSNEAVAQIPAGTPVTALASADAGLGLPASANSPSAALIPQVHVTAPAATVQPKATAMSAPSNPASHALTIKDVLSQHTDKLNQILEAQIAQLQATLSDQADTVVAGTNAVIQRSKQHTEDFKAILGQFSNLPDGL